MSIGSLSSGSVSEFVQSIFSKIDADQSGGVSLDEMLKATDGSNLDQSTVASVFAEADGDGDGELSASELQSVFAGMATDTRGELLSVQETSSDTVAVGQALASYAASAGSTTEASEATGAAGGAGGGGGAGGAGGAGSSEESTDPADLNGDGVVTAAEQAAYDATHGGASTSTSGASSSPAAAAAGSSLDLAA